MKRPLLSFVFGGIVGTSVAQNYDLPNVKEISVKCYEVVKKSIDSGSQTNTNSDKP